MTSGILQVALAGAVLFAAPQLANAQATRTWVSGVGDDANPCSRTAPCKTFAGAISKTAAGGEIDTLDPGGYGTLTITKAITVDGGGMLSSVLASGTVGFNIVAGATDRVILRNLSINGAGTTLGTDGVRFTSGSTLSLENVQIFNFSNRCVKFEPATRSGLVILDSNLENCGVGAISISTPDSTGVNRATITRTTLQKSQYGVSVGTNSNVTLDKTFVASNGAGGLGGVIADGVKSQVAIKDSNITNNQVAGVHTSNTAIAYLADSAVTYTNGTALVADTGGQIITWGNNYLAGNTADGAKTSTAIPQ